MSPRIWLKLGEIIVPILLAIIIFVSWQADRRDRAALAAQLAAAQKTIADATASQHNRDTLLNQTLAQINDQKQATLTTAQILNSLQAAMSLPSPITQKTNSSPTTLPASLSASATSQQSSSSATNLSSQLPNNPTPKPAQSPQTDATLPAADLKPLYDFALDCKACQAKLTASQSDLADEKTKTAALIKERDAALTAAKGGSTLRRIARAAKWFAIGAAAGAVAALAAAKTSH
jgi:cobalamin biosynthesis Mg chelatase CobN